VLRPLPAPRDDDTAAKEWERLPGDRYEVGGGRRTHPPGPRRVPPPRSPRLALAGEGLVELDADLGQIGAALDGQAGIGPCAEPALQDAHVLEAHLPELLGDLDAGPLVGRRAIRDDGACGVELEPADARLELLGVQTHRARDLERQGLIGFGPTHIE